MKNELNSEYRKYYDLITSVLLNEIDDDNEKIFEVSNFHHLKFVFEHVQHIYGLSVFFN